MAHDQEHGVVKILIAEDERNIGDLLLELLDQEDRRIKLVQNGVEAIEALKREPFDLLITDLMMPEVDGMEVLHEAKRLHPNIMVIIITGYASLETAIQAVKEGAYDYLRKPFRLEELKISVDNACEKIKLQRENEKLIEFLKRCRKIENLGNSGESSEKQEPETIEGQKALFGPEWFSPFFLDSGQNGLNGDKVISEIERLARLKAQGVITNEEFDLLKKKLFETI